MFTNVNLSAPLGVMALLGTALIFVIAGLAFVYTLIRRQFGANRLVLAAAVLVAALYVGVMLLFAFASSEKVLARGQEKHFCEIDCHLAYSVTDVRETHILRAPLDQLIPAGTFRVVTIKTRFDENTIGPNRGDALLYPNSRVVTISDDDGHQYFPSAEAAVLLDKLHATGTAMTIPLRPGESYSTTLVFDLPADLKNPTLLVREGEWVTHLVIGHENSPLHKKTRFQI